MFLFAQVEREHGIAGLQQTEENYARSSGNVPEPDNGVLAVKKLCGTRARELLGCISVPRAAALDAAACERAPDEIGCQRRHGVDCRDQREHIALPLHLILQEAKDSRVKRLQMVEQCFFFHGASSSFVRAVRHLRTANKKQVRPGMGRTCSR